jgi:hypothetical protein
VGDVINLQLIMGTIPYGNIFLIAAVPRSPSHQHFLQNFLLLLGILRIEARLWIHYACTYPLALQLGKDLDPI